MTPFGPQLIGETEKTLNALLRRLLADVSLTEAQWVTLRLAGQQTAADIDLAALVRDRAHFADGAGLVDGLRARGLLTGDRLSESGRRLVAGVQARVEELTGPIWRGLDPADVAAAERVLDDVTRRVRDLLAAPAVQGPASPAV